MFRFFWSSPCDFQSKIWICRFGGKIGNLIFFEISAKSGIWMKCSHRSHDVRTTYFFKAFCSHGCSHVSRVFARLALSRFFVGTDVRTFRECSHDVRTQAVGQRVCARFDQNLHKSGEIPSFRLVHPKIFEFFCKENLDQLKMNTSESFGYLYSWFCVKTEDSPNILMMFTLLANLDCTFQNFLKKQSVFQIEIFTYFVLKSWSLSSDPDFLLQKQINQFKSKVSEPFATITDNMRFRLHFSGIFLWVAVFTQSGIVDFHVLSA